MKIKNKVLGICSIIIVSQLQATPPNIGDIMQQIKPPNIEKEKYKLPTISDQNTDKNVSSNMGEASVYVDRYTIDGNKVIDTEILLSLVNIPETSGREMTISQIEDTISKITKYYRQKGYFVARAYLPRQNINTQNGVLNIKIIEGEYGAFHLKNSSHVDDQILQSILDDAKENKVINTSTLERAILLSDDLPGCIVSKADVVPGSKVGTSDFLINTEPSSRYDGYLIGDNYGSHYSGKERLMGGMNINSPLGYGDRLNFRGMVASSYGVINGGITYEFPLMSNGLKSELGYHQTKYELHEEYEALDASGKSSVFEAKLTYPLIRTKLENLNVFLTLADKNLKDEVRSVNSVVEKDALVSSLGLEYDLDRYLFGYDTNFLFKTIYTFGKLEFKDDADRIADKAGVNTQGNFQKIYLSFGEKILFDAIWSMETSLQLQYALNNKNLDSTEDFGIGGAYGVKVYPSGEESAENGYLFNIELFYQLAHYKGIHHKMGLFYDAGRTYSSNNRFVGLNSSTQQDIGVGYYANYKEYFFNTQLATLVGSKEIESEPKYHTRLLVQIGWIW